MQLPMDWIFSILKLVIPLVHFQTSLTCLPPNNIMNVLPLMLLAITANNACV
jgi:hypothetical protein